MNGPLPPIGRRATLLALRTILHNALWKALPLGAVAPAVLSLCLLSFGLRAAPVVMAPASASPGQPLSTVAAMSSAPQGASATSPSADSANPSAAQGKNAAAEGADHDLSPAEQALALDDDPPTRVRVAVLNASGKAGGANTVALLLGDYKRRALEEQLGLQIELVNLSTADLVRPGKTIIYYRPEFLRAALIIARAIPGEQYIAPMRPLELKKAGMDVEIVVGTELP